MRTILPAVGGLLLIAGLFITYQTPAAHALPQSTPQITSITNDTVYLGYSPAANINGTDLDPNATVTVGGHAAVVESYLNTDRLDIRVPASTTLGAVDVVVTNPDGGTATFANGITYIAVPPKLVTGVSRIQLNGHATLKVDGANLVGISDALEYAEAVTRSMVSLNGTPLPMCADGFGVPAADIIAAYNMDPALVSDTPLCYFLLSSSVVALTLTQALIWIPDNFDMNAAGSVSVNGSNVFTFGAAPVQPTVSVVGGDLTSTPQIAERPTFSGTAAPESTVTVTVHSDPVTCTATADSNGNWSCTLPANLPAGQHSVTVAIVNGGQTTNLGPYTVTVDGTNSTTVTVPNTGIRPVVTSLPNLMIIASIGLMLCVAATLLVLPTSRMKR
jgi:hypothetical protein